jgi:hypothetical protein
MTPANGIPAALTSAFRAGAFFTDALTALPNKSFSKPLATVAWCAVFNLPSAPDTSGINSHDEYPGVFQIDLNYPLNMGAGAAQAKADAIRAVFKRGAVLGGVEIVSTSTAQGVPVDGWYRVPVSVTYRAFVGR